jgi:hypothetical protein
MNRVPPAKFSPELVILMRSALNTAVDCIDQSHRTPATKAKMAQRIVRTASEGITDLRALTSAAVDEGREPAARWPASPRSSPVCPVLHLDPVLGPASSSCLRTFPVFRLIKCNRAQALHMTTYSLSGASSSSSSRQC